MSWTARLSPRRGSRRLRARRRPTVLAQHEPSSIVIVTGQQATMPIPTLMEGLQNTLANYEIADQLFLRLAAVGPGAGHGGRPRLRAAAREELEPARTRSPWSSSSTPAPAGTTARRSPRATWSSLSAGRATARSRRGWPACCAGSRASPPRATTASSFRFKEVYAEQLYDATFHVAILPAHLLASLPPTAARPGPGSPRQPVGSGPYRWVRRVEGQFIELAANQRFLSGPAGYRAGDRPGGGRARTPESTCCCRGEADAMDNIPPPPTNLARVEAAPHLRAGAGSFQHPRLPAVQPTRSRRTATGPIPSSRIATCGAP